MNNNFKILIVSMVLVVSQFNKSANAATNQSIRLPIQVQRDNAFQQFQIEMRAENTVELYWSFPGDFTKAILIPLFVLNYQANLTQCSLQEMKISRVDSDTLMVQAFIRFMPGDDGSACDFDLIDTHFGRVSINLFRND